MCSWPKATQMPFPATRQWQGSEVSMIFLIFGSSMSIIEHLISFSNHLHICLRCLNLPNGSGHNGFKDRSTAVVQKVNPQDYHRIIIDGIKHEKNPADLSRFCCEFYSDLQLRVWLIDNNQANQLGVGTWHRLTWQNWYELVSFPFAPFAARTSWKPVTECAVLSVLGSPTLVTSLSCDDVPPLTEWTSPLEMTWLGQTWRLGAQELHE